MPLYKYDVSVRQGSYLLSYYLPVRQIPLIHANEILCLIDLPESGVTEIELPHKLVTKLKSGSARILASSNTVPERQVGEYVQNLQISSFDVYEDL